GRLPAHPPWAPVLPRRSAPLDVDLPHRRERVPAGARPSAGRGVVRRRADAIEGDAVGTGSPVRRSGAARSPGEGDRPSSGELPFAGRGALLERRAVRGAGRGAADAARHGEDAAVSREAAAAAAAGNRSQVIASNPGLVYVLR